MNEDLQTAAREEIRDRLELTQQGKPANTAMNYKTVFQNDPLLKGAIRKNLLTERTDIVKPLGWYRESSTLTDVDIKYLLLYFEEHYGLTVEKKIEDAACNPSKMKAEGIQVFTIKAGLHDVGLTTAKTPFGHTVPVYDMERTICDLLRSRSRIEIQTFQGALKSYARRKDKNLRALMQYAGMFKVEKILRQYLEVLL